MSVSAPEFFRLPPSASRLAGREWEEQMRLWLGDQLDQQHIKNLLEATANAPTPEEWVERLAIADARAGDPTALRKRYPHFADCIFSPKLGKGKKYPKQTKFDLAKETAKTAAEFAPRIRALWQKQYRKKNRKKGEKSAEEFAIEIIKDWSQRKVTMKAVLAAAKPSGKHKLGPRSN
jgi:hypothetical protein